MGKLTYHNDPKLKESAILNAIYCHETGKLVRNEYWNDSKGKGCAIGCHAHHIMYPKPVTGNQREIVSNGYGWPLWLCYMEDRLFTQMTHENALELPERLCEAVPVGHDLDAYPVITGVLMDVFDKHSCSGLAPLIRTSILKCDWEHAATQIVGWVTERKLDKSLKRSIALRILDGSERLAINWQHNPQSMDVGCMAFFAASLAAIWSKKKNRKSVEVEMDNVAFLLLSLLEGLKDG